MASKENINYNTLDKSPYNKLLNRESDLTYQFGRQTSNAGYRQDPFSGKVIGSGDNDGTTQTQGGSVSTIAQKTEGNSTDVWIRNFIRSSNWKPKNVGFYIDGATGYAEFAKVFISGTITVASGRIGGFDIGSDYIRDRLNTMGMASTVTGADDVRFWAGDTFANRALAPFRILESGAIYATSGAISGGALAPGSITYTELAYPPLSGATDPSTIPGAIGQIYVNTTLERIFIAGGTTSVADWQLINSSKLPIDNSIFESITASENINILHENIISLVFDSITISEDITITIV